MTESVVFKKQESTVEVRSLVPQPRELNAQEVLAVAGGPKIINQG